MMAAKSRMRTMLNSSPWITAVTSLRFFRTDRGHLPGTEQLAPRQKLQRGDDRQQADGDKDREFCHEGLAVEVIVRPFLRSEEHTSELQSQSNLVCRLLLHKLNRRSPISSCSPGPR